MAVRGRYATVCSPPLKILDPPLQEMCHISSFKTRLLFLLNRQATATTMLCQVVFWLPQLEYSILGLIHQMLVALF